MCYLGDVGLRCEANHDVQLLQFNIDWVIVLYKENLHLVFQDLWTKKGHQQFKNSTEMYNATVMQLVLGPCKCLSIKNSEENFSYRLCTMRFMFLSATYCNSGSAERRVTSGGASFFSRVP